MIKKIKLILLSLTTLVFFSNPVNVFAATLGLDPGNGTYNKGCILGVKVNIDTQNEQTDGADVILIYDPSKFTVATSDIVNGTIYQDYPGNSVDQASGKLSISGISVSAPFSGKGQFALVNFHVKDTASAGSTSIKIDFDPNDKTKTTDSNVAQRDTIADLLSSVFDGNYTIGSGSGCTQTVTASPSPGTGGGTTGGGTTGGGALPGLPQGSQQIITAGTGGPLGTDSGILDGGQTKGGLTTLSPGGNSPGLTDTTTILAIIGTFLTIAGILGLAIL